MFNCHVEFPDQHPVPYVLQWEKKVGDTVRYQAAHQQQKQSPSTTSVLSVRELKPRVSLQQQNYPLAKAAALLLPVNSPIVQLLPEQLRSKLLASSSTINKSRATNNNDEYLVRKLRPRVYSSHSLFFFYNSLSISLETT